MYSTVLSPQFLRSNPTPVYLARESLGKEWTIFLPSSGRVGQASGNQYVFM